MKVQGIDRFCLSNDGLYNSPFRRCASGRSSGYDILLKALVYDCSSSQIFTELKRVFSLVIQGWISDMQ